MLEAPAPKILLPTFVLPSSIPGSAQWVSPFPEGNNGFTSITLIHFAVYLDCAVTVHLTPPSTAAAAGNRVIPGPSLTAVRTYEWLYEDREFTIPAAYSLWFFASVASACNCTLWGINRS